MSAPQVARSEPRISAIVLAAGVSSRAAPHNKLLATDRLGRSMVARVALNCLGSRADSVVVVTGSRAGDVERSVLEAAPNKRIQFAFSRDFGDGLSASLRTGLSALAPDVDGALVCLGDMPLVESSMMDRMIGAFDWARPGCVVVPCWEGQRGNPVLWGRSFFAEMSALSGDTGARNLLGRAGDGLVEILAGNSDVLVDFDTPEALSAWQDCGR